MNKTLTLLMFYSAEKSLNKHGVFSGLMSPAVFGPERSDPLKDRASPGPDLLQTPLTSSDPEEKPGEERSRAPAAVLSRIFPGVQRGALDSALEAGSGDVVRAVELLLGSPELGSRSAFSPLRASFSPRLRLAYSTPGFFPPYLTSGFVPALSLRPPAEYLLPGALRDLPYHKDSFSPALFYSSLSHK